MTKNEKAFVLAFGLAGWLMAFAYPHMGPESALWVIGITLVALVAFFIARKVFQ